ncbi:MAG: 30S ribosomal protein S14 [Bosea sp. (in: a-proteobacteria)]|jgi:small subunit ribosomal protein S14|uniref:30S ribosomal protein S14 n=1 Tax=unclassified Bosea (in: a-proteobacteria) TaxID=2653178 RepID=UPI00083E233B|nr:MULTISPECIES: 30S ribosomal protein S14 [unclassified Bosea (in: a-proteobacteria)]MBA4268571.1 30S ribosomal protein S14 [Methylobacterium sp.]MBX9876289.1 30S ribosomal protein S14 [Beijerinckiaceae bacterium]OYW63830.1 MAG: 30S ribosomal protein S14 [Bosea sp. 12-68-7]OYX02631.1 MAG: 30S ribosomal protein S14 [Bosea sp. 32-68-6]AOG05132.1 ribosomal S14p/S29e family protein [Bosea sp. RAC05]
MAKKSSVENNNRRKALVKKFAGRRARLLEIANDEGQSMDERFLARLKLAELPRNSAPNRVRNRCEVTGRPRAFYRKLKMSRVALRELGNKGLVPGLVKSSW